MSFPFRSRPLLLCHLQCQTWRLSFQLHLWEIPLPSGLQVTKAICPETVFLSYNHHLDSSIPIVSSVSLILPRNIFWEAESWENKCMKMWGCRYKHPSKHIRLHQHIYIYTCIALHYITLHCITLHYITLHYIALRYARQRYVTLRFVTLRYIALHTYHIIYIIIYI